MTLLKTTLIVGGIAAVGVAGYYLLTYSAKESPRFLDPHTMPVGRDSLGRPIFARQNAPTGTNVDVTGLASDDSVRR